jgi:hypothetical protein
VENKSVRFKVGLIINKMIVQYNTAKAQIFEANAKFK